jgi:phage shock protein C
MNTPTPRLMRSRSEKVFAGVAGGIATYLAIDPVLVRLAFVALIFTGAGIFLYPILWVIMPVEGSDGAVPSQAFDEMRAQFERAGERLRHAFDRATTQHVAQAPGSQPDFEETEIPINDMGNSSSTEAPTADRNRQLGILLLGVGSLIVASMLFGPHFGKLLFPALLIGAGLLVLRRK